MKAPSNPRSSKTPLKLPGRRDSYPAKNASQMGLFFEAPKLRRGTLEPGSQASKSQGMLSEFAVNDIYSCGDATFDLKPNEKERRVLVESVEKIVRRNKVSVLLCCNSTSSDKRKLLVLAKNKPKSLTAGTLSRIDVHYGGSGALTKEIFRKWLGEFDKAMQKDGRKIALIVDSSQSYSGGDHSALTNITVAQVQPGPQANTKTLPMPVGITRSFLLHYAEAMLEVWTQPVQGTNADIPNGRLWGCLADGWNNVPSDCIHNCFARIPVMPVKFRKQLRGLGIQLLSDMDRFRTELKKKYADNREAQHFVWTCEQGSHMSSDFSAIIRESIQSMIASEMFHHSSFKKRTEDDFIDEDLIVN